MFTTFLLIISVIALLAIITSFTILLLIKDTDINMFFGLIDVITTYHLVLGVVLLLSNI